MDLREAKALELAARCRLVFKDGAWVVPSQTSGTTKYRVTLLPVSCECEDFTLRQQPCKHIMAARLTAERDGGPLGPEIDTDVIPIRKTYRQNWPAYNEAQSVEKDRFQELLADLVRAVDEPTVSGPGRKPHLLRDRVFSMVFKVYSLFSGRRFSSDLREAHRRGHITVPMPGAKLPQFFDDPDMTPVLKALIARSSLPLKAVETTFSIDSSGFGSSRFERWYDQKYGVTRQKCLWVKCHIACGTKTNVVTAVRILDKDANDCPQFVPLVNDTAKNFTIGEVSADKAYASLENFEAVAGCGGTAFIAFKSNATGGVGGMYERMFHYFQFRREEFLEHYHRRSNIESTFSMVKRLFGDSVKSKTDTAMTNEVLCKLLCHNIVVLIHEQHELGIEPMFWGEKKEEAGRILALPTLWGG